jgi:hypothetical protein
MICPSKKKSLKIKTAIRGLCQKFWHNPTRNAVKPLNDQKKSQIKYKTLWVKNPREIRTVQWRKRSTVLKSYEECCVLTWNHTIR